MRALLNWPFLVALALLGATAILGGPVAAWLEFVRHKEPLPLVKPLPAMDHNALGPYRVVKVEILSPEELEALRTRDVISWWLEDSRLDAEAPSRLAHFLVTFYTGAPSLVPHTPELCWVAHGYQQTQAHEDSTLEVANLPQGVSPIPVRLLTFGKTGVFGGVEQSVIYTFFCNGRFTRSRNRVRSLTSNPFASHAFYSKVEVSFVGASRADTVERAADLLSYVLPELLARHWPDFKEAENQARRGTARMNE